MFGNQFTVSGCWITRCWEEGADLECLRESSSSQTMASSCTCLLV
jgi:hypothetical protein